MTRLTPIEITADREKNWHLYALHVTNMNVIEEFFLVSNYKRCIKLARNNDKKTIKLYDRLEKATGKLHPLRDNAISSAKEIANWSAKMEKERYHELYVNAFIGMWSSFEAGLENAVSDFLERDDECASDILKKIKKPPRGYKKWPERPWSKDQSMQFAKYLEYHSNRSTKSEWWDTFSRIKIYFSHIGIEATLDTKLALDLAEANAIRNTLLHRYGEIGEKEIKAFPELSKWNGKVIPFDRNRFARYYHAITGTTIALMKPIREKYYSESS